MINTFRLTVILAAIAGAAFYYFSSSNTNLLRQRRAPIQTSVSASGSYKESGEFGGYTGSVEAEGAAAGSLKTTETTFDAQGHAVGSAKGQVDGVGDFSIEGAASAQVGGESTSESIWGNAAVSGKASSNGRTVEGSSGAYGWADANGRYGISANYDACFKTPNGECVCYYGAYADGVIDPHLNTGDHGGSSGQESTGVNVTVPPGFYDQSGNYYGSTPSETWVEEKKPGWYDPTQDPTSVSAASSVVIGSGFKVAAVASIFVLLF